MVARVTCPHCSQKLKVREDRLGQQAECPGCRSPITLLPDEPQHRPQRVPTCTACGDVLRREKLYRMSGPVVVLGYVLIIPSFVGILAALAIGFVAYSATDNTFQQIQQDIKDELLAEGVAEPLAEKFVTEGLSEADLLGLERDTRERLLDADTQMDIRAAGAAAGSGVAFVSVFAIGAASLLGYILGYLLVMKKNVLKCNQCGAVLAAS